MNFKKWMVLCMAVCLFTLPLLGGCQKKELEDTRDDKYIVMQFTNTHYEEVESYAAEMKVLFGENDPASDRMYAAGFMGPMLLTQSIEQMQAEVNTAFDMAEKFNIPVYFQLDDVNNYTTLFGGDAEVKYWEDPSMCEWIAFPEEGEEYGGQNKYGALPRFWYNWGSWRVAHPMPNFASPKLQELIVNNLKEGFLKPLTERYNKLKEEDKAYLFAGVAVGWETHIADYTSNNRQLNLDMNNLPRDYATGVQMQEWEVAQYGYSALHSLGYDQAKLDAEAAEKGIDSAQHMRNILYQVIHDYSELLAKTVYDAGVPRRKIFTHTVSCQTTLNNESTFYPPIWVAVNEYSTPGYTMSPVTCKYDMTKMKQQLFEADPTYNEFACAEGYAAGLDTVEKCDDYFAEMFGNGARVVTCFGYPDVGVPIFEFKRDPSFPYIISTNNWLRGDITY